MIYVGIDLGTTNSVICSYDGKPPVLVWKSAEQNDVTPSAIYLSRRERGEVKYIGKQAYDLEPQEPTKVAMQFKREMGTRKKYCFGMPDVEWTPEQCSAEVLKELYRHLREDIQDKQIAGTVVTVPHKFSQPKRDATEEATVLAGLGKVELLEETKAAMMSVMRGRDIDGHFLIFDLGGGTFDVTVATNKGKVVTHLGDGGIERCGGRDFDRAIRDSIVRPWLLETFDLPENFYETPEFDRIDRLATWATENAKIALSSTSESVIDLPESIARCKDRSQRDMYVEIPLNRETYDTLISNKIDETVEAARETLNKVGVSADTITEIVFIGGPTQYKPLRDAVSAQLQIPAGQYVNPMTAVAEGACLHAETLDWSIRHSPRKSTTGQLFSGTDFGISFQYDARTTDDSTALTVNTYESVPVGTEIQVDNLDTGWTSGRRTFKHGTTIELVLGPVGQHRFRVHVLDGTGRPIPLEEDTITITRVEAIVDAIHASRSIAVEAFSSTEDKPMPHYLLRSGDKLPKKGAMLFKTTEELDAEFALGTVRLKLWDGEIEDPISDNRFIGVLRITGADLEEGTVPEGARLNLRYEVLESGKLIFDVLFPEYELRFEPDTNFYSRQEAQPDYTNAAPGVAAEGKALIKRITNISDAVDDPRLEQAHEKAAKAAWLKPTETDGDLVAEADACIHEAKKKLAVVRAENLPRIRQMELEDLKRWFQTDAAQYAKPSEKTEFDETASRAQDSITTKGSMFEQHTDEMWSIYFRVLRRQDWYVVDNYERLVKTPHKFTDQSRFKELRNSGDELVRSGKIDELRALINDLYSIYIFDGDTVEEMARESNIAVEEPDDGH